MDKEQVKKLRESLRLTQEQFADLMGVFCVLFGRFRTFGACTSKMHPQPRHTWPGMRRDNHCHHSQQWFS